LEAEIFLVASAGEKREPLPCRNQARLRNTIEHVSINLDAFDLCFNEGSTAGHTMVQRHFNALKRHSCHRPNLTSIASLVGLLPGKGNGVLRSTEQRFGR